MNQREQPPRLVAALHAHSAPVLGVAWSDDESRLASTDKRGVVVLWQATAAQPAPAADEAAAAEEGCLAGASLPPRPSTA